MSDWKLTPIPPDFSLMSRDALEDYAANADHQLRLISEQNVRAEQKVQTFLAAVRAKAAEAGYRVHSVAVTPARMLAGLNTHARSRESLMAALYRHKVDEAVDKIIDVFICRVRPTMALIGCPVETVRGQGYCIPNHARFLSLIEAFHADGTLPELIYPDPDEAPNRKHPPSPEQVEMVITAVMEEATNRQAAARVGITEGQVSGIVQRARKAGVVFPDRSRNCHRLVSS